MDVFSERLRATSIVWRFAVTSFIVFGLIGVGIGALRAGDLRTRSEEAATVRAELIAESVIAPLLVPEDLRGPIRGVRYQVLDRAIHEFAMDDAGVERVKIWNVDGMVVFSNDREQVGLRPEMEEDLLEAFEGEVASEISDLSEAENVSERALADQLFETHVPVHLPGDGESTEATAVIEVYQDYSAIQLEIDHLNDTLKISLGIGLLVLYVLLLPRDGRHHPDPPSSERPTLGAGGSARGAAGTGAGDGGGAPRARPAEERLRGRGFPRAPDAADHDPGLRRAPQGSRICRRSGHERCDRRDRAADGAPERLVGNLLQEAQLEHGGHETWEESTSVADVLGGVRRGFPGSVDRIHVRTEDLPSMLLDPVTLHEVVVNLVDNALKYSTPGAPRGGLGRGRGERAGDPGPRRGSRDPSGRLPRIFDRFTQIDGSSTRAHGGVGLGLHLVRELTRRSGGEVKVDSVMGKGTTFTVTLPIATAGQPDPQRPEMTKA